MKKILLTVTVSFLATSGFALDKLTFETNSLSESNNDPKYEIKINYPQIKSPTTKSEKKFNAISKKWAIDKANKFKNSINELDTRNLSESIKANSSTLTARYELFIVNPVKIISTRFTTDSYIVGAAHGSHLSNSINYDLLKNKTLSLLDLFKSNSKYLNEIAEISTNHVRTKLNESKHGKVDIFEEGLTPNSKNYSVWNFTPQGFRFIFNEYQVAAYVFGPQEIVIPYQKLKSFYKPGARLTNCLMRNTCEIIMKSEKNPAQ